MPSMNISLTPELMQIVQVKVESGMYNNVSEVIHEAIRQLDRNIEILQELKRSHLKAALAEGVRQAESGDVEPLVLEDLIQELNGKR